MKKISVTAGLLASVIALTSFSFGPYMASAQETSGEGTVSPNGRNSIVFYLDDAGAPTYRVQRDGSTLMEDSTLGFELDAGNGGLLTEGFELLETRTDAVNEQETPVWGFEETLYNHYNETTYCLAEKDGLKRRVNVILRAYDTGVAFRYYFPEQDALSAFKIMNEKSTFQLPAGTKALIHDGWSQGIPVEKDVSQFSSTNMRTPMTFLYENGTAATLHEASLYDYARIQLSAVSGQPGKLVTNIKWAKNTSWPAPSYDPPTGDYVNARTDYYTPWRLLIISDSQIGLLENNSLIYNLNDPCKMEDTSWITAGKTQMCYDMTAAGIKKAIDFAVFQNDQYVLIDSGWYGTEDDRTSDPNKVKPGENYLYSSHEPPSKVYVDFEMEDIMAYAREKGVKMIFYVNHIALEDYDLETLFTTYENWGIAGVKFGFINYGSQYWTNWFKDAVEIAAKHHIAVVAHDEDVSTGFERTYPNLLSLEGILGDEGNVTASDDLKSLFTRSVANNADHTYFTNPGRKSTAFNVALPLFFYSGGQALFWEGANPDTTNEKRNAQLKFWRDMPGSYDEVLPIEGEFGRYATLARRAGDEWFLGSINSDERDLSLAFDFLGEGKYVAEFYASPEDAIETSREVLLSKYIVDSETVYSQHMPLSGGLAIHFYPASDEEIASIPDFMKLTLQQTIDLAKSRLGGAYTTRSKRELTAAIEEAQAVYEDLGATKEQVNEASAALSEKIDALRSANILSDWISQSEMRVVSTSSPGAEGPASNMLDGSENSIWHSYYKWEGSAETVKEKPPHWVIVDLGSEQVVTEVSLINRPEGGHHNGIFLDAEIYTSMDGEAFTLAGTVTWPEATGARSVSIQPTAARYVKVVATRTVNDYGVIAEFNVKASPLSESVGMIARAEYLRPLLPQEMQDALNEEILKVYDFIENGGVKEDEAAAIAPLAAMIAQFEEDMATISGIRIDGVPLMGFALDKEVYTIPVTDASAAVPVVSADKENEYVNLSIEQAWAVPGDAVVTVQNKAGSTYTYTLRFRASRTDYLSDLDWVSARSDVQELYGDKNGVRRDYSYEGPLALNINNEIRQFSKGIGMHANAEAVYDLEGLDYTTFESYIGVNAVKASTDIRPSVTFEVWGDGVLLYDSGMMGYQTPAKFISLDITGVRELKLVVTDGNGDISADHANWCDTRLVSVDSAPAIRRGDVDDSGSVGVADLLQIKQMILRASGTDRQHKAADVNRDGVLNIFDLVLLKLDILKGTV